MSQSEDGGDVNPETSRYPLLLVKASLWSLFLLGIALRIYFVSTYFIHLANLIIWVAVLGRLFVYVRGLKPVDFLPAQEDSSPLGLVDKPIPATPLFRQQPHTPLERVIFEE